MAWNPLTLGRASASSDNLLKSLLIPQKPIAVRLILFSAITNMAAPVSYTHLTLPTSDLV